MSLNNEQYRELFIEEAKEHIETLTKSMLVLEKDPKNADVINMLFRSAHTLKGSSGMMGFTDFQELTHAMEDVFDGMRKGSVPSSTLISVLLECVDALSLRLDNIQNRVEQEIDVALFAQRLHSETNTTTEKASEVKAPAKAAENVVFELSEAEKTAVTQAENRGEKCFVIDVKFSSDCSFKNIRANMLLEKLAEIADVIKSAPNKEEFGEEQLNQGLRLAVISKVSEKEISQCVLQICEVEKVEVAPLGASPKRNKDGTTTCQAQVNEEAKLLTEARSSQTVRVKFDQLDKLMNLVGELVINKIALVQASADSKDETLKRISENIDRLTASLQGLVMQVRMVPVSQVFDRFPRLVRDLSLKEKKKINLVMEGREIEVDRTVLDEIGEPLIHLLRNCVDHGIELPDERSKHGKEATGTIKLVTRHKEDHIIIEVEDDGAGINGDKVKKAAVEKQLLSEAEAKNLTDEQAVNLIFLPGLSTAKQITETSGRGVGMDVVKTKISSLGGKVEVETHMRQGTRFTLTLPSTLAIIKALLVKDTEQTFAIPTGQVSEVVSVKRKDITSLGIFDAIEVRGKIVPLLYLKDLLNLAGEDKSDTADVLVTYGTGGDQKIGLAVNAVVGLQEILIKPLDDALKGIKGFGGVTMLGNGTVVFVLDLAPLIVQKLSR